MIIYVDNAGGFIMKDLRKFSGTNKSPARLMAGSKVSGKKEKLGPSFSQIWYAHTYVCTYIQYVQ